MPLVSISAPLATSLSHFLSDPQSVLQAVGVAAVAVLHDNQPCFYVLSPQAWSAVHENGGLQAAMSVGKTTQPPAHVGSNRVHSAPKDAVPLLARQLLASETQRMERGDLSPAAVGILRNRLKAHVLPFFRNVDPSCIDTSLLEVFVERLTAAGLSTTTMSQYLVVVRKLLRLAVRQKLLHEMPEMPRVRVVHRPRSMLTLHEYLAVVRAAHRLIH